MMTNKKRAKMYKTMDKNIEETGFQSNYIFGDNNNGYPPYLYTTGLMMKFNHPELVVFGLSQTQAHTFIHIIVNEILKKGKRIELNKVNKDFFSAPICFAKVKETEINQHFGMGSDYLEDHNIKMEAIQFFWSDREGAFPFEVGFQEEFDGYQPIISEV